MNSEKLPEYITRKSKDKIVILKIMEVQV